MTQNQTQSDETGGAAGVKRKTPKTYPKQAAVLQLLTSGQIAVALGVRTHRVEYMLKTRRWLQPMCRGGRYFFYSRKVLDEVRKELKLDKQSEPKKPLEGG